MNDRRRGPGPRLILASGSPRRQELLREAGIHFEVITAADAEPNRVPDEDCAAFAVRAAVDKAGAVALENPGRTVLGADTIVVVDDDVLGKPKDAADARRMLARLSSREHHVYTGVAVVCAAERGALRTRTDVVRTAVRFRELTEAEIEEYVATGEPLDKAGAYGIQGMGGRLVESYEGSYTNVVGLPMETTRDMLGDRGSR